MSKTSEYPLDSCMVNQNMLSIVAEVADAEDTVVPRILVKLNDILRTHPQGSQALAKMKQDMWSLGLPQIALATLKQDFSKILDGWNLAQKIANILCIGCAGLVVPDTEVERFSTIFIPDIIQTVLILCQKIQIKFIKTSSMLEDTKKDLFDHLKSNLDSLSYLCCVSEDLLLQVLRSPWLLQMLLTDDTKTSIQITYFIQAFFRKNMSIFSALDEKVQHQILDELIFKIASSCNEQARSAFQTVNLICECHISTVELLSRRYRGLAAILSTWQNHGFDKDLRRLNQFLKAGTMREADLQRKSEAATLVQALWRSYSTRRKIQKANQVFAKFQQNFRSRRVQVINHNEVQRNESDLQHLLAIRRKNTMKELRKRQLEALQILSAGEVERYLQQEKHDSATQIQKYWKGYQTRKNVPEQRLLFRQVHAAKTIQRTVRNWLGRLKMHSTEFPAWQRPPGMTDQKRVELQSTIMDWRQNHETLTTSTEGCAELHYTVQQMVKQYVMSSRMTRQQHQKRELLLSRLEIDAEILLDSPKLIEATDKDIDDFTTHSVPIATKAKHNHLNELRLLRQPWWRKLGDEYQDQKYEEDEASKIF